MERSVFMAEGSPESGGGGDDTLKEQRRNAILHVTIETIRARQELYKKITSINKKGKLSEKKKKAEKKALETSDAQAIIERGLRITEKRQKIKNAIFGKEQPNGSFSGGSEFYQKLPQRLKDKLLKWRKEEISYSPSLSKEDKEKHKANKTSILAEIKQMPLDERKLLFAPSIGSGKRMFMFYGIRALEQLSVSQVFPEMAELTFGRGIFGISSDIYTKRGNNFYNRRGDILRVGSGSVFREGRHSEFDRVLNRIKGLTDYTQQEIAEAREISTEDLFTSLERRKEDTFYGLKAKKERYLGSWDGADHTSRLDNNFRLKNEDDKTHSANMIKYLYNKDPERFQNLLINGKIGGTITLDFLKIPALERYVTLGMILPSDIKRIQIDGQIAERQINNGYLEYIYIDGSKKGQSVRAINGLRIDTKPSLQTQGFKEKQDNSASKNQENQEKEAVNIHLSKISTQKGREELLERDRIRSTMSNLAITDMKEKLDKRNETILTEIESLLDHRIPANSVRSAVLDIVRSSYNLGLEGPPNLAISTMLDKNLKDKSKKRGHKT